MSPTPIFQQVNEEYAKVMQEKSTIAVIGYGNQGRAQALNLRDSGFRIIIGNREDDYLQRANMDGFETCSIHQAVQLSNVMLLLIPDEVLPSIFQSDILPYLKPNDTLVFASGYSVAFEQIALPAMVDVLLIAPRMIGVGVRERYLTREGFYCFVGVHQDANGYAQNRLLALTWGIGRFYLPAIQITFKQEAVLDLFNEQAFGPAFGRTLLTAIDVLIEKGLPPEAALVEMYMSQEMAYTYQKMAQIGLVNQTLYHSQTSQYGAMSRAIRFLDRSLKQRMVEIYDEIDSGSFAREWNNPLTHIKFKLIRYFALRQSINKIERQTRKRLGLREHPIVESQEQIEELLSDENLREELRSFEDAYEF